MTTNKPTTLVIGAGLIGTSVAMGLIKNGYTVFIEDIDQKANEFGLARSGAHKYANEKVDLIVVATPPSTVAQVIRSSVNTHPAAIVTDVASVKGSILNSLADLPEQSLSRIVGGHPMAGREVSGAAGAQGNLFVDRSWVVTKLPQTSAETIALVEQMIADLGADVVTRAIDEHDQAVALISHTPQVIASVLAGELVDAEIHEVELAGQGLRDTIRIASSDAKLWADILSGNAKHVASRVASVATALTNIAKALESGDRDCVWQMLERGITGRERLPGKHGAKAQVDSLISVRLEDKPGELARLFTVAATVNVNLEDVRIDHALGRMTGLVELTVAEEKREILIQALTNSDFVVING